MSFGAQPVNMGMEANKELVKRFVQIVKNERKLDRLGEFFATDYKEHNDTVASFGPGVVGYQNFLGHLFAAFPDDRVEIELITVDGDLVSYRARESGTHTGVFLNIPATGKRATWTEIQFFRFESGKIVEHWVDVDIFSWFQQLGIIPAMG
ncbi:MAG: ester cyclase [Kofleriaceae bacterium]